MIRWLVCWAIACALLVLPVAAAFGQSELLPYFAELSAPPAEETDEDKEGREKYDEALAAQRDHGRIHRFSKYQPVLVRITEFQVTTDTPSLGSRDLRSGVVISTGYDTSDFHYTGFGIQGAYEEKIAPEKIERLHELLSSLPPDGGRLPPLEFRLLIQADEGESFAVRFYDRRNLPDEVLSLLRLIDYRTVLKALAIPPEVTAPGEKAPYSTMALTADGRTVAASHRHGGLELWDLKERHKIDEVPGWEDGVERLTFSPDGRIVAAHRHRSIEIFDAKTWTRLERLPAPIFSQLYPHFTDVYFSRGGSQLAAHLSNGQVRFFDVATWQKGRQPFGLPSTTTEFHPDGVGHRAVVMTTGLTTELWDLKTRRSVAELETDAKLGEVAFSRDGELVAIETIHRGDEDRWNHRRIRIADARTGKWRVEVWPHDVREPEEVHSLHWTADGLHLIGAVRPDRYTSTYCLCLWDAASGREAAWLPSGFELCGVAISRDGQQIATASKDGHLRFWSQATITKKIAEFESSKPPRW